MDDGERGRRDPRNGPRIFAWSRTVPCLALAAVVALAATALRLQGRLWWCACGDARLWNGSVQSAHNSQHLFDPYSVTHLLHGLLFFWLLAWLCPRLPPIRRLVVAIAIEAGWEVLENTGLVIRRFRAATMSFDYLGDTVANAIGDILACGVGFALARRLGFRRSVVAFVMAELLLLLWIRDGLVLNILMLIRPSETIRAWQTGR